MAHLRSIQRPCATCGKPATVELVNRFNSPQGSYCKHCGQKALKRQQATEDHERAVVLR